jgi:nitrate reductase NapAB chaperone NapD
MPIGGFVIQIDTAARQEVLAPLGKMPEVELHGEDGKGNLVAVLDCETSQRMEKAVEEIAAIAGVLNVGLVYIHAEDEVERIAAGDYVPSRRTHPRRER